MSWGFILSSQLQLSRHISQRGNRQCPTSVASAKTLWCAGFPIPVKIMKPVVPKFRVTVPENERNQGNTLVMKYSDRYIHGIPDMCKAVWPSSLNLVAYRSGTLNFFPVMLYTLITLVPRIQKRYVNLANSFDLLRCLICRLVLILGSGGPSGAFLPYKEALCNS